MNITWQRYLRDHCRAVAAVLALLLFAGSFFGSRLSAPGIAAPSPWWPGVVLSTIGLFALPWRNSHPRAVAAFTGACAIAVAALGFLPSMFLLGPAIIAFFTLANRTDRRTANSIALTTIVLESCASVLASPHETIDITVIAPAASLLLPVALGTTARVRRAYVDSVHARAEHAERTREQEARHRVSEERVRIARELHDVVAHHLALANAQAGTAAHLIRTRPELAEKLVAELAGTTSSALRELKATVGLLRQTDDADAPLYPSPGLAQLPDLTASLATAGLQVAVTTDGEPQSLSPGVDLTAFRIVQEALTNITKHAATQTAHIHLAYTREQLGIYVLNDSPATVPAAAQNSVPAPGSGFGLIGMRERAQSVGGQLRAGHRPEGGFEVIAQLPLHPRDLEQDQDPE